MSIQLNPALQTVPPALREVSLLVNQVNGINLGQGICKLPAPEEVTRGALQAIKAGYNLYAPAQGVPELRKALFNKLCGFNKLKIDESQILISPGSTGAFEAVCQTLLSEGDEVISFKPFYPYHHNALLRTKARINYIELTGSEWKFDSEKLASSINSNTRFILLNTPGNPTGKVFSREELEFIAGLCQQHDILCVSDEVYEYMTYDGHEHISPGSIPGLEERTIAMGSYSKTFSITGWRIGYMTAPIELVEPLRCALDQLYVCAPTPLQHAVASGINNLGQSYYDDLRQKYTEKRELLSSVLERAGFSVHKPQGAYYIITDIRERFPKLSSEEAVLKMIEKVGVGAVPASDFLGQEVKGNPEKSWFMRWCYALPDSELSEVEARLSKLN